MSDLPIEPGSELDRALTQIAWSQINGTGLSEEIFNEFLLLNPSSSAEMLALGVRIYFLRTGVDDPTQLVAEQYGQWYGKPMTP